MGRGRRGGVRGKASPGNASADGPCGALRVAEKDMGASRTRLCCAASRMRDPVICWLRRRGGCCVEGVASGWEERTARGLRSGHGESGAGSKVENEDGCAARRQKSGLWTVDCG